jgi:5'(3')-deoxyribonucleotidase
MKKKNSKIINLDMDGTILDFSSGVLSLFGLSPNDNLIQKIRFWDALSKVLTEELKREVSNEELWQKIDDAGSDFWANLDWLPWGKELLDICQYHGQVVLMSTPSKHPSSAHGKIEWINRHLKEDAKRHYALTPCKHYMAHSKSILIDDSDDNVSKFIKHGGGAYLIPQPWNSNSHKYGESFISDVSHFLEGKNKPIRARRKIIK